MSYILGQIFGIISSICCFINPFFKKKWMMLVNMMVANALVGLNFLLIGQFGAVIFMQAVAVAQTALSLYRLYKNTKVTVFEQAAFLVLYIIGGIAGIVSAPDFVPVINQANLIELMPIGASVLFSVSVFVRNEQKTRLFGLLNAIIYLIYMSIVGSTTMLAQIFTIITTIAAMCKYKKR